MTSPADPALPRDPSPALQALLDAAVDAVILIDAEGRIEIFNRAAERLFGWSAAEMLGRSVSELMPEPDRSAHGDYIRRYLATGIPHIIGIGRELSARRRDGSSFPASLAVGRVAGEGPPRFVAFIQDITLRREALATVARERDRTRQYLDAAQTVLLATDVDGRINMINRKGCEVLGLTPGEVTGSEFSDLVPAADRAAFARRLQEAQVQAGDAALHFEQTMLRGDRGSRLLAWRCVALRDPGGTVSGVLCSGEDVTSVRQIENETRRSQERLTHVARLATMGEMAAGIAHELNQPLAAIANYAQASERLLALPDADLPEIRDALRQIAGQALRAGEIIRRLRSLVRRQDTARVESDVNALIEELGALTATDTRMHDVRLRFDPGRDLPRLSLDPVQIQQVLLNLVRNAIEAMSDLPPEQRGVLIRTAPTEEGGVEISVTDSGPGVDPQILDRLFDPFCTTKPEGTGLGLAISRSIVAAHRGTLRYEPPMEGGSRFVLRLPPPGT